MDDILYIIYEINKDNKVRRRKELKPTSSETYEYDAPDGWKLLIQFRAKFNKLYNFDNVKAGQGLNGLLFPCGTYVHLPERNHNKIITKYFSISDKEREKTSIVIFESFQREVETSDYIFETVRWDYCHLVTQEQINFIENNMDKLSKPQVEKINMYKDIIGLSQDSNSKIQDNVKEILEILPDAKNTIEKNNDILSIIDEKIKRINLQKKNTSIALIKHFIGYSGKEKEIGLMIKRNPWILLSNYSASDLNDSFKALVENVPSDNIIDVIYLEKPDEIVVLPILKNNSTISSDFIVDFLNNKDVLSTKLNKRTKVLIYGNIIDFDFNAKALYRNIKGHDFEIKTYDERLSYLLNLK